MDSSKVRKCGPASGNTGYTYSRSSSYSTALDFEKEQRLVPAFEAPRMSRRSLRLHTTIGGYGDDSLLDSPLNHITPYSTGLASRRESKALSRRSQQHSVSCVAQPHSQSLLPTPRKSQSLLQNHNSSLHSCAASDASLLSSMLDESCIQERTLVDSFWGLDEDSELKERTCSAEHSHCAQSVNGVGSTAQTQTSMVNGYSCKDCNIHSDRKEALTAYPTSTSAPAAVSRSAYGDPALAAPATSPISTVYRRDQNRKKKSGLLMSLWGACVHVSRRASASVACVLTLLFHDVLLRRTLPEGKGVLLSMLDTGLRYSRRAAASTVSGLTVVVHAVLLKLNSGGRRVVDGAHSCYCRSMNVNESNDEKHPNGSLCDDCKGKQHSETHTLCMSSSSSSSSSSSWASRSRHLLWALWGTSAYTGSGVLWMGQKAGSAGWAVTRRVLSALWLAAMSPGKAVTGVFWWLGTGWYHLVTLMSLLNVFVLTRCLPKLRTLLLFLLPFLLILALLYWGPSSLLSVLPAINITEWRRVDPLSSAPTVTPLEQAIDSQSTMAPPLPPPPASSQAAAADTAAVSVDSERLARLEQSLAQLWEKMEEGGGQRLEQQQQHREVLGLYRSLQEQLATQTDRDSMGTWVSGLLEERLRLLKGEVEKDAAQREQAHERYAVQHQGQESRLAELEALLQALAVKTEEVQKRQETAASAPSPTPVPVPISVGVDSESHDALLAEVQRLEAALGSIRQDLQGVMGCQGMCDRLDSLHDTVSAQVRREVQNLFYGSQQGDQDQAEPGEGEVPESLLQWLSERYVSGADLQAYLASMELSILQNVSLQLEQSRQQEQTPSTETLTQTVEHTVGAVGAEAGMSEEHVQLIVKNALRLYSQDRTGLVDYALESGGGSVLGTRCSETYETKTALMSLFGLPLWYFSQSPRVVIQPDVQPGNCWAFKGSNGYLVIRLSMKIRPTAFSLEHIPKSLSPTGVISSAPRQFTVYGLDDEYHVEGKLLGSYTYQDDGEALQTYPVSEENDQAYQIIEFRVLSNWGHPHYTCLYRIRVHGEPTETC